MYDESYLHILLDELDNIKACIDDIIALMENAVKDNGTVSDQCALALSPSAAAVSAPVFHQNQITALD
jgi:hypothetical protein